MSSFKNNQSIVISPIGDLTAEGIDCLFGMYGEIRHIYFDHDRYNQRICWLCYALPTFAQKAIDALDGEYISGRKISVDLAPFMRKQRRIDDRSRDYSDEPDESDDYDSEYSNASSESEDIPESPPKARHSRGHRSPSRHSHHRHHHSHHYRRH